MSEPRGGAGSAALTVLTTGGSALARGRDLDQALRELLGAAVDGTGASRVALFAQDPDRAALELVIAFGWPDDALVTLASAAAQPEHPLAVAAASRTATFGRADAAEPDMTYADLPLVVARSGIDEVVGVVSFGWSGGRPDDDEAHRLLGAVADLAAVAVDRWRLTSNAAERSEWYERMAHSDPLTGLANARTIDRVLELEIARASRQGSEVSVAVFDVDDFVATNAAAGRAVGDDVLRQVAAVLAESVRLVDTVARYGGDEFLLVAPGSAGLTVARRVIDGIARLPEVAGRRISVSAGIARFPADGTDGPSLIAAATAARQGAAGRGAVVAAAGATGARRSALCRRAGGDDRRGRHPGTRPGLPCQGERQAGRGIGDRRLQRSRTGAREPQVADRHRRGAFARDRPRRVDLGTGCGREARQREANRPVGRHRRESRDAAPGENGAQAPLARGQLHDGSQVAARRLGLVHAALE